MSTSYKSSAKVEEGSLVEVPRPLGAVPKSSSIASTPAEALEILRNEPDYNSLISTLRYLSKESDGFNITSPSPIAAQLVHVLISNTVPHYWNVLRESQNKKTSRVGKQENFKYSGIDLLLSCLRSVTGLNAVMLKLKEYIRLSREAKKAVGGPNNQETLIILLQLLQALLEGDQIVELIWDNVNHFSNDPSKKMAIEIDFLGLIGGGKLLGIAAEAEDVVNELSKEVGERHWTADGTQYSLWLARNIINWSKSLPGGCEDGQQNCGRLLTKSLRLGYDGTNGHLGIYLMLTRC